MSDKPESLLLSNTECLTEPRPRSPSGHSLVQSSPPALLAALPWEDEEEEGSQLVSSIYVRGSSAYLFGNLPSHWEDIVVHQVWWNQPCVPFTLPYGPSAMALLGPMGYLLATVQLTTGTIP